EREPVAASILQSPVPTSLGFTNTTVLPSEEAVGSAASAARSTGVPPLDARLVIPGTPLIVVPYTRRSPAHVTGFDDPYGNDAVTSAPRTPAASPTQTARRQGCSATTPAPPPRAAAPPQGASRWSSREVTTPVRSLEMSAPR